MKDYQLVKATVLTNHCGVYNISGCKIYKNRGKGARGVKKC